MMGEIHGRASLVIAHTGHHSYGITDQDSDTPEIVEQSMGMVDLRLNDISTEASRSGESHSSEKLDEKDDVEESPGVELDPLLPKSSQPAISLMNYLARIWALEDDFSLKGDQEWKRKKLPDAEGENANIWIRLLDFWNEDWFYRSWVLQEAVLGKKVILLVVDAACSLDFVMKFWELAKKRDTPEILKHGPLADEYARIMSLSPVNTMKALRDVKHAKEIVPLDFEKNTAKEEVNGSKLATEATPKAEFLSLLSLSRINLASDSRDKIYSLLSLAKGDQIADSIVPDYSAANTAAILYQNVAAKFIQSGRGPVLLSYAGIDQKIPNLPSWAPDWSYQSRSNMHPELYNCSGSSIPSISISPIESHKLLVRGVIIDTIHRAAMAWRFHSTDREQEKFAPFKEAPDRPFPPFSEEDGRCLIRQIAQRFSTELCATGKYDSEGLEAAMARTLVMDCSWRMQRTHIDSSFLESHDAFGTLYASGIDENTPLEHIHKSGIFDWLWDFDEEEENRLRTQSWPFEIAFEAAHKGRRFCITQGRYMCTTPYDTEREDVVVMFEGFTTPFILRKAGDDWKIVGDCYVHGIMDGELIMSLENEHPGSDEVSIDLNGRSYSVKTSSGFATFQNFGII